MAPSVKFRERILVTGASGFVGSYVLRELRAVFPHSQIWGCRYNSSVEDIGASVDSVNWVWLDLNDENAVYNLIQDVKPTSIIHLAAIATPRCAQENPKQAWKINFKGTLSIANAVMKFSPEARFVYVSTSEVYGLSFEGVNHPLSEMASLQPTNIYGATKAAADIALRQMACDGLDAVCFRPFNHTGPGQSEFFVASAFSKQVAEMKLGLREPKLLVGNTNVKRDFLDVRDVARAYVLALKHTKYSLNDRTFNLATGNALKVHTIVDYLTEISKFKFRVEIDESLFRSREIESIEGDFSRAKAVLGWEPQIAFKVTIGDLLNYWCDRLVGK